jgi:hypothetical protein
LGTSGGILYDETFSKFDANGKLEEYWCSSGAKIVFPSAHYKAREHTIDCLPTALVMVYTAPGPTPIFIRTPDFDLYDRNDHAYIKLLCDV